MDSTKLARKGRMLTVTRNTAAIDIPNSSYSSSDDEEDSVEMIPATEEMYLFNVAASGDIEKLKQILNTDGMPPSGISNLVAQVLSNDKTRKNRNVLHLAAGFQGEPSCAEECVTLILQFLKSQNTLESEFETFINAADDDGATPLYLAAKYENMEACKVLLGGGSDLDKPNKQGKTPIMKLFKKMPSVIADLISERGGLSYYVDGERQIVNLHFRSMISIPMEVDILKKSPGLYREMDLLSNLSYTPIEQRYKILEITHVKALVWIKWQHYKWLFWLARAFQISWFLLYITYLLTLYRVQCPFPGSRVYNFSWIALEPSSSYFNYSAAHTQSISERNCATPTLQIMAWLLMISAVVDVLLIEGYPTIVRFRRKWFPVRKWTFKNTVKQIISLFRILHMEKLTFLLSIIITTVPINFNTDFVSAEAQYVFASLGMFLACFHIFLQLGKFPQLKGYIKIFTNTLTTLCIVLLLYGTLIFAFAMVFCILLPGEVTYASPFEALIRVFTFTIGEVDFEATFYGEEASPPASFVVAILFFGSAIVVLHIALLNYLIGLTINELREVWKQATLWKTYTFLWQIFLCETFISNFPFSVFQKFLYKRMVLRCKYETAEDAEKSSKKCFYKTRMDKLPKYIRHEIRNLNLPWIPKSSSAASM